MNIRIAGIVNESIVDGPGIRYVVFAQGCPHKCKGCHNPDSHFSKGGYLYNVESIIGEIANNKMLDGITCSGGECFEQADKFAYLAKQAKVRGLSVWAYTGYTYEQIINGIDSNKGWKDFISYIDVLVDGRYEEEKRDLSLTFRATRNQRIIDVQKSLKKGNTVILELDRLVS